MITIAAFLKTKHDADALTIHGEAGFWRERGAEYARKFFAGVRRHVRQPVRCVLMTDTPEAVPCDYGVHYLPLRHAWPGWWAKLNLFQPGLLSGTMLYCDLDTVFCDAIDELLALRPAPLIMLDDIAIAGMPNAGMLLADVDSLVLRASWEGMSFGADAVIKQYRTWPHAADQAYLADLVRHFGGEIPLFQRLLPDGFILNAREQLERGLYDHTPAIIYGSGHAKPHASDHYLYEEHWRDLNESEREMYRVIDTALGNIHR